MSKNKIDKLYQKILEKLWNAYVDDYMKYVFKMLKKLKKMKVKYLI